MTPAEKFAEVLDRYEYRGIEPIECWDTDDLIELQEAIRAELADRDIRAQNEYFENTEETDAYEGTECNDPLCMCHGDDSIDSYGGTN